MTSVKSFRLPRELALVPAIVLVIAAFAIINPNFIRIQNLNTVLIGLAFIGIVAVGQTIVVITGNFDLSVGSTAALTAVVGAELMSAGVPIPLAILAMFATGVLVGLVNGLVTILGVPSFIVTIATLYVTGGIALFITGGQPVYPLPPELTAVGSARPMGVSIPFLFLLLLVIAVTCYLQYTRSGRRLYAVGGAPDVAKLIGLSPRRVVLGAFIFCSLTAATAGLFQMAALNSASNTIGSGWELSSIAAVVIGGASIFGGSGSPIGTVLGALLLGLVSNGLVAAGVPANWQTLAVGAIMIAAVSVDLVRRRGSGLPLLRRRAVG
ncbi:ABC transporter permease [soil metagenome]